MANLIQVQNDLKNLSDEELQSATQSPTGDAPPFMLLAETNRRKTMRDSYAGEQARQRENQTTVMEDLTGSPPPPQGLPGGPPPGMGGPPPGMGGPPPGMGGLPPTATPPGFANGGMIGGTPAASQGMPGLAELAELQSADRADLKNMALLNAGLRMMGGTSPIAAQNIALAAPAVSEYQQGMRESLQDQIGLTRIGAQYEQEERANALQGMQFEFQQRDAARKADEAQRRLDIQQQTAEQPPASIRAFEIAQEWPPEKRQEYYQSTDRARGSSTALTLKQQSEAFKRADDDARKEAKKKFEFKLDVAPEIRDKWIAQRREQFIRERYPYAYDVMKINFNLGASPAAPQTTPGGVSIVESAPTGAKIQSLTDPLLYGPG